MAKIFLSYRRSDASEAATLIYDRLSSRFGKRSIYFDIDSVPAGIDFRKHIQGAVESCDLLIAVIGDKWLQRDEDGNLLLSNEDDFVRIEIETALTRDIPVIPVPVGNADVPSSSDLPEEIGALSYRNARELRMGPGLQGYMDRLIAGVEDSLHIGIAERAFSRNRVGTLIALALVAVVSVTAYFGYYDDSGFKDNASAELSQSHSEESKLAEAPPPQSLDVETQKEKTSRKIFQEWPVLYSPNYFRSTELWNVSGEWSTEESTTTVKHDGGVLNIHVVDHLNGTSMTRFIPVPPLRDVDFDAIIVMPEITHKNNCIGLTFRDRGDAALVFEVCGSGKVSLHQRIGSPVTWSTLKSHRFFNLVNESENHLRVRAQGDDVFLFLNDQLVIEHQVVFPERGNIGVFLSVDKNHTINQSSREFTVRAPGYVDKTVESLKQDQWPILHDAKYFNENLSWIAPDSSDSEHAYYNKTYSHGKIRMYIEDRDDSSFFRTDVPVDPVDNFEISADFRDIRKSKCYGFTFRDVGQYYYLYRLCSSGNVDFWEYDKNRDDVWKKYATSNVYSLYRKNASNSLRLRVDGKKMYLFLNEALVLEMSSNSVDRGNLSVYVGADVKETVDVEVGNVVFRRSTDLIKIQ